MVTLRPPGLLVALDYSGADCPSKTPQYKPPQPPDAPKKPALRPVQQTFADIPLEHYRRAFRKLPMVG